jgi:hypothetical protein
VKIQELLGLYSQNENINKIAEKLNQKKQSKIYAKGLVGSIDAILAACRGCKIFLCRLTKFIGK